MRTHSPLFSPPTPLLGAPFRLHGYETPTTPPEPPPQDFYLVSLLSTVEEFPQDQFVPLYCQEASGTLPQSGILPGLRAARLGR